MIDGVGIDIEEVGRFATMIERWGGRFTSRIFTDDEVAYCESKHYPPQHYAARFAAKEAFGKAIGTGWNGQFAWKNIEVSNALGGKPSLSLHNGLQSFIIGKTIEVSLSHTRQYVAAVVIIHHDTNEKCYQEVP